MPSNSTGFWVAMTKKSLGERVRAAVDRHLALLHRLEQRGLRLRRRAVDLVRHQHAGEDRPAHQAEGAARLVVDVGAHDVGRHQVGRELDAPEVDAERGGEGAGHARLADAGDAFEQRVPAGHVGDQQGLDGTALPQQVAVESVHHAARGGGGVVRRWGRGVGRHGVGLRVATSRAISTRPAASTPAAARRSSSAGRRRLRSSSWLRATRRRAASAWWPRR